MSSKKVINGVSSAQKAALDASNSPSGGNPIATMNDVVSEWDYTEVTATSAQLDALTDVVGKQLLPASGAGTYNDVLKMIFEYSATDGGHNSGLDGQYLAINGVARFSDAIGGILTSSGDVNIREIYGNGYQILDNPGNPGVDDLYPEPSPIQINTALTLKLLIAGTLISSDGELLVKIWYKVRTVGSEL
jgi:hypothetical protein